MKPYKSAFVTYRFLVRLFYSTALFAFVYLIIGPFVPSLHLILIPVFLLLQFFTWYSLSVQYKKEKYTFFPNRIVRSSGGIFSEHQVELVVRNITHVTMELPYMENKLMKTGSISIESAGSGKAEIHLSSIGHPKKFYSYVERLMKHNGFKLAKSNLIQRETPNPLAVFIDVFGKFGLPILFGFLAIPGIIRGFSGAGIFSAIAFLGLVGLSVRVLFHFLDLKKRVYKVYASVITYSEGFLSKNYSFIPIENLSDSELNQGVVDQFLGIYDLKISCQGSGQEIHFRNVSNGQLLEDNIDKLINGTKSLIRTGRRHETLHAKTRMPAHRERAPVPDTKFTARYRMQTTRTLAPFFISLPFCMILVVPMVPWLILLAFKFIVINSTRYLIKAKSVESRYSFMTQKNVEFANEKITGIVFKENALDRWFGTCSIVFWSIGSSQNITFSNVRKTPGLYDSITAKKGIRPQEPLYRMNSGFSFLKMLKANALLHLGALIAVAGLIVLVISIDSILSDVPEFSTDLSSLPNPKNVISNVLTAINLLLIIFLKASAVFYFLTFVYKSNYYKRSKLAFYRNYVHFEEGVEFFNRQLFRRHHYSDYKSIKDVTTTKYPLSESGKVTFNVAGESVIEYRTRYGKKKRIVSHEFGINYADDMKVKNELVDLIFHARPGSHQISGMEKKIAAHTEKPVVVTNPDLINSLINLPLILGLAILLAFIFILATFFDPIVTIPLAALVPAIVIVAVLIIKAREYVIQPHRVVAKSGILYRKQVSVVFSKVDHINISQGPLNKIFGTGNVSVNTTGSSKPEIVIRNIKDFRHFYDVLKRHY